MSTHTDRSYIFCTPLLKEIKRVREECGKTRFREPFPFNGTKIEDFNSLLSKGENIAVTHTTFLNATTETVELLRDGGYTLIIDEALDVVTEFNKTQTVENAPRQSMNASDLKLLLEHDIIRIGDSGRVSWSGGEYGNDCKYAEVERFANLGRLYCSRGQLLLVIFPPELFKTFDNIFVMTYMFDGSLMKYYFDIFGLEYETKSVCDADGVRLLIDYEKSLDTAFRSKCKELIHICDKDSINDRYRSNMLSKRWYEKASKADFRQLQNDISTYFSRYLKAQAPKASNGDIMWTTFGDFENKVKGKGYTRERQLTAKEKALSSDEQEKITAKLNCFVPCNARATNDFRKRWALAYCVNMHFHPFVQSFFESFSCDKEIKLDKDIYALSCMIQWIFRSRIRDGEPIEIYIPSQRMRKLLQMWLDDKI